MVPASSFAILRRDVISHSILSSICSISQKAALAALVSGLAEPVGALLAYLFLHEYLNPSFLNGLMILIAGVMIWVSLAELWPEALEFGKRRAAARGMAGGILLMTLGIILLS